ncbi:MAG TPA: hypothetical protein VK815_10255 [Candidatus Acidoferrales bacterium]|jgi:hypothetical protein|nr:hypothetical protein [Candidatus Acidoferrales bacterium]
MRPKTLAEVAELTINGDLFDRCLANFLDEFYAAPKAGALADAPPLLAPGLSVFPPSTANRHRPAGRRRLSMGGGCVGSKGPAAACDQFNGARKNPQHPTFDHPPQHQRRPLYPVAP